MMHIHLLGNLAHFFRGQLYLARRTYIQYDGSSARLMHKKPTLREHKVAAVCSVRDSTIELTCSSSIH